MNNIAAAMYLPAHNRDAVAYAQNGRNVTYREVCTEDLIADVQNRRDMRSAAELNARNIDWTVYVR